MHVAKLIHLARMVGMNQNAIARHLGVHRVEVSYWSRGKRPIPAHYLQPFLECVQHAVETHLANNPEMPGSVAAETGIHRRLKGLLLECQVENLELRGVGPSTSIPRLWQDIGPYATMPDARRRHPEQAVELYCLAQALVAYAEMNMRLGQLMNLAGTDPHDQARDADAPSVA